MGVAGWLRGALKSPISRVVRTDQHCVFQEWRVTEGPAD